MVVDYVRGMAAEKSSKYCDSGSFEHLVVFYLFLSLHFLFLLVLSHCTCKFKSFFFCNSITVLSSVSVD